MKPKAITSSIQHELQQHIQDLYGVGEEAYSSKALPPTVRGIKEWAHDFLQQGENVRKRTMIATVSGLVGSRCAPTGGGHGSIPTLASLH